MRKILQLAVEPLDLSQQTGGRRPSVGDPAGQMSLGSFSFHVMVILGALLCALICALLLNYVIRCALHYAPRAVIESGDGASAGLRDSHMRALPAIIYNRELDAPGMGADCPICLAEFVEGENVRVLPKCSHSFHIRCIDKWLLSHSSCPTCRRCLLDALDSVEPEVATDSAAKLGGDLEVAAQHGDPTVS